MTIPSLSPSTPQAPVENTPSIPPPLPEPDNRPQAVLGQREPSTAAEPAASADIPWQIVGIGLRIARVGAFVALASAVTVVVGFFLLSPLFQPETASPTRSLLEIPLALRLGTVLVAMAYHGFFAAAIVLCIGCCVCLTIRNDSERLALLVSVGSMGLGFIVTVLFMLSIAVQSPASARSDRDLASSLPMVAGTCSFAVAGALIALAVFMRSIAARFGTAQLARGSVIYIIIVAAAESWFLLSLFLTPDKAKAGKLGMISAFVVPIAIAVSFFLLQSLLGQTRRMTKTIQE